MATVDEIVEKILSNDEIKEIPISYKLDIVHIVREVLESEVADGIL